MKQHTCELCHTVFNRKEHLYRHTNKLRKCNVATEFECQWCSKSFTVNSSLNRHINTCKVKCNQDQLELKIQEEAQLTNNRVEELEAKYKILEDKVNTSGNVAPITKETNTASISGSSNTNAPTHHSHNPITTTTNSHNTTNHITINNYGKEDLSHITLKRITFVFSKSFGSVVECVKLKHFSPHAPQNKNICIKDLNSRYAYVFCDGNWDAIGRKKLIDEIYTDICEYIEEKLDELIDELSQSVIFHIKRFLDKKDDDEYADNIKIDLETLIFNKRDRIIL
jgi:transcription elongation factor Elf1